MSKNNGDSLKPETPPPHHDAPTICLRGRTGLVLLVGKLPSNVSFDKLDTALRCSEVTAHVLTGI